MLLQALFSGLATFLLVRFNLQFVWALPAVVLWLHFGFFFDYALKVRLSPKLKEGEIEAAKRNRKRAWILTWAVGFSAVVSTVLLVFGVLHGWELLFLGEFIFFEGIL